MDQPREPASETSIVIIDDHDVIHTGISTWCADTYPPIRIIGNYFTADDFLADHSKASDEIDVVLLDLELRSRRPAFEALDTIIASGHRVVMYSHIEHAEIILECLDRGACAYLVKSEGRKHLIDAIYAASAESAYTGPCMAAAMAQSNATGRPSLSSREKEVLTAWFQTESKELVAQRLCISVSTVQTHLQRARTKYAAIGRPATTKSALIARAIQDGILSVEEV